MLEIKPKKFKVHSLTGRITPKLMEQAWKAVKRNKGAPGIDRVTVKTYHANKERNLDALMRKLKTRGAYKCPPLRRHYIPKGNTGKMRPLGIPTVDTRCAQEVIRRLIEPIYEKQFHDNSFGFRPGRSCHQAVERVLKYTDAGYKHIVEIDIKGFFDNIPHNVIMTMIGAEIADGNILDIIETFLGSGVVEDGKLIPTTRGAPQGGVFSPLIGNIVLNYLDWKLQQSGYEFVRYADDLVILCKSTAQAENALTTTVETLKDLGLEHSPEKTKVTTLNEGFQFLGFNIGSRGISIREKSREKFEDKIKEITTRSHNFDDNVIKKLNQVIRGTVNYFHTKFSNVKSYFKRIDQLIRTRIRSMKYKSKSRQHHFRLKNKTISRRGLLSCRALCEHAIENWCSLRGKQHGVAH
jgi:RNA-directed DNA polymerase